MALPSRVRTVNALVLHFLLFTLAGWIQSGQQNVTDYLVEERGTCARSLRSTSNTITSNETTKG